MMRADVDSTASLPSAYKLDPAKYPAFRKRLLIRLSVLAPLLVIGFSYLSWRFDTQREYRFRFVFIAFLVCWIAYRQFRDQRRNWESLEFDFRDGKLIRSLDRYPPLEFRPDEVTAIIESPKGIAIKTNRRLRTIFVSSKLSNYESFRRELASWAPAAPVEKMTPGPWHYVRTSCALLACAWVFGGPLYLMYTHQRAIILPLGVVLTLSMLAMILYVRNSPHIPVRAQRGMWVLLLLPILAVMSRLVWA